MFVSFCLFSKFGLPPPPVPLLVVLGGPPSPVGRCPPGSSLVFLVSFFCGWAPFWVARLLFSPRPSGLNPVGFPFLAFLVFAFSAMALRAFRRTVSLDVSQLAVTNDRKKVCELIVNHFANHKIHAVQFVGTAAKVTFAVEASKQEVINHQAINISGVQCAVRGGGPRAQNVLIYNYPVEGSEESIRRVLGAYGVIERISFRHWTHLTDVSDGVRVVRMTRRLAIPRNLSIAEVNVKVAYAGQQQVCDLCHAPGHIARACPLRDKCFQCGLEGHFSRDCPQRVGYRDRDAVLDPSDPTPAEAAGRSAVRNDPPVTGTVPDGDADSLDGVSVSSAVAAAGPTSVSQPDADLDSVSDDDLTPSVDPTLSGSSSMDCRDNQLDELSSQPLFTPSASSVADPDSLQGVTIDSACPDSFVSPPSPGQGSLHSASNLGLLDKLKSRVGLNKKKVNSSDNNSSSSNNDISNGNMNGNKHSDNDKGTTDKNGNKHSDNGKLHNSKESDINDNVEYIGQGVLAGRENNSEMELAVDSQKRSHPDSDSVDSVDSVSFAMPKVLPPRSSKKKPAVVVSPGTSRPVAVDHDRDRSRSRSPKRSSSASRPPSSGSHALPPSIGYVPKPPRSSGGSRNSKAK